MGFCMCFCICVCVCVSLSVFVFLSVCLCVCVRNHLKSYDMCKVYVGRIGCKVGSSKMLVRLSQVKKNNSIFSVNSITYTTGTRNKYLISGFGEKFFHKFWKILK